MSLLDALLLDPAPFNVWIAYRTDGIKGSGTASDPYNGSDQTRFDGVMQTIALLFPNQKVAIHLGPGVFITAGFADGASNPWEIKAGMKILGSGREATIIKRAAGGNSGYVLGHDLANAADFFELCDVTLDCNLTSSPSGGVSLAGSFIRIHRVRVISFCTQARAECFGISLSGGVFNVVENCILERPGQNNTHETTLVANVGDVYGSAVSPIVRHNYANCSYVKDDGSSVSSQYVAVATITQQTDLEKFVLVTKRPHQRTGPDGSKVTNNVLINGVGTPSLNGSFPVVQKDSDTQLVFKVVGNTTTMSSIDASAAYIGVDFHGPAALSGTGCVIEGNAVFGCAQGLYSDTGSKRDAVVRYNYYSGVLNGVNFDFNPYGTGAVENPARYAKSNPSGTYVSLKRDVNDHTIAIFESELPHLLRQGEAFDVLGAFIGTDPNPPYIGTFSVLSVISDSVFTYAVKISLSADAEPPTTANPIQFRSRWQVRRLIYENNICELYKFDSNSALAPRAVSTFGYEQGPPYMFPQAVIRDNLFRLGDGSTVPPGVGGPYLGLRLDSCENFLIENNVIDIPDDNPIHYLVSRTINGFNNRRSSGQPVPLSEDPVPNNVFVKRNTLEDKVSDALCLAML